MEEPLKDQDLLRAIRETEERVRKQVEEARRAAGRILAEAQQHVERLGSDAEARLGERLDALRQERLREIGSEIQGMAGEMTAQVREMETMARARMEATGLEILHRLLPRDPSEEVRNL
jgi:vacuolar-type H+-ATPase subunit H